jgi:hypothetical protein
LACQASKNALLVFHSSTQESGSFTNSALSKRAEITELLNQGWVPAGVTLPNEVLAPDVIASLIRMSGGNFRLLTRLLTQRERILKVNNLDTVSKEIVAAARDSLLIGQD